MRQYLYILDEQGEPQATSDWRVWAEWWERADRHLQETCILNVYVSTIFLGINHNWRETGEPILWETMIFAPKPLAPINLREWRYTSREQALKGHEEVVKMVRRIVEG